MALSPEVKTDIIIGSISIGISLIGLWLMLWSTKRLGGRVDEWARQHILVNVQRSPLDTPLVIVIDGLHFADTGGSQLLASAENSNLEPEVAPARYLSPGAGSNPEGEELAPTRGGAEKC